LIEKISRLENKFEREINYHIYSEKEFREKRNEENSFISKILSKPKNTKVKITRRQIAHL